MWQNGEIKMTELIQSIQTWPQAITAVTIALIIGASIIVFIKSI